MYKAISDSQEHHKIMNCVRHHTKLPNFALLNIGWVLCMHKNINKIVHKNHFVVKYFILSELQSITIICIIMQYLLKINGLMVRKQQILPKKNTVVKNLWDTVMCN